MAVAVAVGVVEGLEVGSGGGVFTHAVSATAISADAMTWDARSFMQ
ncbi:hypothetical protein [Pseudolysinimonas yzui]|nr:hypothetical protein [Pseudolysinimonas yzui]